MNIRRKSVGIAGTALLLASAFATAVAPLASASVTVAPTPVIPRGTTSATPATFTLTENSGTPGCFTGGDTNALEIIIWDSAGANTVHFVSPPTIASPGTLGATASVVGSGPGDVPPNPIGGSNELRIAFPVGGGSPAQEQIIVSANISADAGAATGAIIATLGGNQAACVLGPTGTATGTLSITNPVVGGVDPAVVLSGNCAFAVTTPVTFSPNSKATFTGGDTSTITAVLPFVPVGAFPPPPPHPRALDTQSVTFGPHSLVQGPGTIVTQTVDISNCSNTIGSPGSVANALNVTTSGATSVNVGENSQPAGNITVDEGTYGSSTLLNANNLTFTISSPATGVLFSVAPSVTYSGGDITGPATCALSVDRHTCTLSGITDTAVSTVSSVTLTNVLLDVDSTVPVGTVVQVTVTSSLGTAVAGSPVTIARVGTINFGVAAQPPVKIGFNDQATGVITMTESSVGFFTAGLGPNNAFAICPATGETFTRAPWAVITNPTATDLRLLNGLVAATQVAGILAPNTAGVTCAYWLIYHKSTTAPGTIQIVGSDTAGNPLAGGPANPTDGPRINVPKTAAPGSVQFNLLVDGAPPGGVLAGGGFKVVLSNAIRVFANSVTVTAASQPRCPKGATDCLAGNIVITETQNGQLKTNDRITLSILPRATTQRMDVLLQGSNTSQLPVVATNATTSGLFVSPVGISCTPSAIFGVVVCTASFVVTQQSFGPTLGQITVSNIHYVVAADAVDGPVNVDVIGTPCTLTGPIVPPALPCIGGNVGQAFDSVVTNAVIGALTNTTISSSIAVGVTKATCSTDSAGCAFKSTTATTNSGTPPHHAYTTVRFQVSGTGSDGIVDVYWVHVSDNGALPQGYPGSYVKVASIPVVSGGWAFYFADAKVLSHNGSLRASFIGVVRPSTTYSTSRSKAVQAHWL